MLGRYVKAQFVVLLCGGLVGPIFLAVYFATGQSTELKWMFWVGLLITVGDVLIALALANRGARADAKRKMLEASGILAMAHVTAIVETGTRINEQPLVKLGLHIEGPGLTPFDVKDSVLASLTRLPLITGRKLVVLVDPATSEYQIDWDRSALIGGLMPAQFTLAEDGNRIYDLSGQAEPLMEIMQILKANGVSMDGTIDIRSNPVVRQQVMSVVRRAAAQRVPPAESSSPPPTEYAAPSPPLPPRPPTAQRLQELETLRAMGTITDDEYGAKRQQIIDEL